MKSKAMNATGGNAAVRNVRANFKVHNAIDEVNETGNGAHDNTGG